MLRALAFSIASLFVCSLQAQTKVFKEVGEDISTQVKPIMQDNAVVGYLAFTRLEKASADSFNYRLTIMDENVLCLGYIQSPLEEHTAIRSMRDYRKAEDKANSSHILLQFISLNGKVI